jgi:hypothetical protein
MTSAGATTRRRLIAGMGVAGATGAGAVLSGCTVEDTFTVRPYTGTELPRPLELHYLDRLGQGWSQPALARLRADGGPRQWLAAQLRPEAVEESERAASLDSWFPLLWTRTPAERWRLQRSGGRRNFEYARDLANLTMLRRVESNRGVLETMVDFWSGHLNITSPDDLSWTWRTDYDRVIRHHALGTFTELLTAATLHPAMLLYLDNWRSRSGDPNENHGRELLELHTVGRRSGYTEQMVKDSAKILSGWTVRAFDDWEPSYDADAHATGPVRVLGFSDANAGRDGRALCRRYLAYLAGHPATARNLATKLARRLVSDTPSEHLLDRAARAYLRSGTDIKALVEAIVDTAEFRGSAGQKVRTPVEDAVATCRVLGVRAEAPRGTDSFANGLTHLHGGEEVYRWPRPDGPPDHGAAWSSAARMLSSFRMHWLLAGGHHPTLDVTYRSARSWFPEPSLRYGALVDHLARSLTGTGSTTQLVRACCEASGRRSGMRVGLGSRDSVVTRTLATILDTPRHMTR